MNCEICGKILTGRQRKFCSNKHKQMAINTKHQKYEMQKKRAEERRIYFIEKMGGKCSICGYNKSIHALEFHHTNPSDKKFSLESRRMSNTNMSDLEAEAKKCIILCANCHRELHHG